MGVVGARMKDSTHYNTRAIPWCYALMGVGITLSHNSHGLTGLDIAKKAKTQRIKLASPHTH